MKNPFIYDIDELYDLDRKLVVAPNVTKNLFVQKKNKEEELECFIDAYLWQRKKTLLDTIPRNTLLLFSSSRTSRAPR